MRVNAVSGVLYTPQLKKVVNKENLKLNMTRVNEPVFEGSPFGKVLLGSLSGSAGAIAGFALAGPVGALLGLVAGAIGGSKADENGIGTDNPDDIDRFKYPV